jgi:Domain of unknown function (DU1801)
MAKTKPSKAKGRRGMHAAVDAVFRAYPPPLRKKLAAVRRLILDTARKMEGVGAIEETLKWGQPSFLTSQSGSGSMIRIDSLKSDPQRYALYFHCRTNLVSTFRNIYPEIFRYEGNRAIILRGDDALPEEPLRHCIALALTYHRDKRRSG